MSDHLKVKLNNKIGEFLPLLKEVFTLIKQFNNTDNEVILREQLKSISKNISGMESRKIPIPVELRNLKTSLINQISEGEEIKKIISDFYSELKSYPILNSVPKTIGKQITTSPRKRNNTLATIKLKDLINDGLIVPNSKVVHHGRKITYYGIITQSGQLQVSLNGTNKIFDSPSGAAESIKNAPINGWDWWFLITDNKEIKLSILRDKYHNKYK